MKLRNMLKICLAFWKSQPQYAYKRYAYEQNMYETETLHQQINPIPSKKISPLQ